MSINYKLLGLPAIVRAVLLATAAVPGIALAAGQIVMHRDPGCGCCSQWAAQVRKQFGRSVTIVDDHNRAAFQKRAGVPADLSSCHTAIVDGLVFEGHVPIADMKRLLASRPAGVKGLAVPGMPIGSPGMEVGGMKMQPFSVIAFGPKDRRVFAKHPG